MPTKTINAAILGTGMSLTVFHHPLLVALPELYKVHTVLERSGKETCRSIVGEGVKIVKTYEEVLADEEVDLVVVSTPNPTHWEYVKRALEAGKHGKCAACFAGRGTRGMCSKGWEKQGYGGCGLEGREQITSLLAQGCLRWEAGIMQCCTIAFSISQPSSRH